MQVKFDKALYGSEKDSPFVTNLKQQAATSDLYFSTDRTNMQYEQIDKPRYEQEKKDLAQYGRPLNIDKSRMTASTGNVGQEIPKGQNAFQWAKDYWNSLQNVMDRNNKNKNNAKLIMTTLPNLIV